jgi:uncharacterized membrane protein
MLREETPLEGEHEAAIFVAVHYLELTIEIASVIVVGIGFALVVVRLAKAVLGRQPLTFDRLRLGLARYLALALEPQLAADIIGTAISPTWQEIAQLGAIAVIRTGLNVFLSREMKEETQLVREENELVAPGDMR